MYDVSLCYNDLKIARGLVQMPELCRFFGIIIRMYYDDHPPPHFHAIYNNAEVQVGISPIVILNGQLPRRATSMVLEWAALHQIELLENWNLLQNDLPGKKIDPLD